MRNRTGALIPGLLLVALGAWLLAGTLGVRLPSVATLWPEDPLGWFTDQGYSAMLEREDSGTVEIVSRLPEAGELVAAVIDALPGEVENLSP